MTHQRKWMFIHLSSIVESKILAFVLIIHPANIQFQDVHQCTASPLKISFHFHLLFLGVNATFASVYNQTMHDLLPLIPP